MDPSMWWTAIAILGLIALSAFFSGSETALTAVSRATMHQLAARGSRRAATALRLTRDSERLIGAILLGNNLVNILAASLATSLFTTLFGPAGVAWATLVMTFFILVFAEVAPKTYAITAPEKAALWVAPAVAAVVRLFSPVVAAIRALVRAGFALFGVRTDPDANVLAPHELLRGTIALQHQAGGIQKAERDRLLAALELRERTVAEVMRHRRDIASISADAPVDEIIEFCLASPYTRIPLWRGEPENIVGVLHAKDLLRAEHEHLRRREEEKGRRKKFDVLTIAMKPWFIPETRSLDDQLRAFLKRRQHFALVVDEYGALQGLVTLEDILEEIVGEITDEHDIEAAGIHAEPDGSVVVPGAMTIRDLNRACEWNLPDDEATTVAGLVMHEAQTIPSEGQVFVFHGFRFEVLERRRNRITRLRVKPVRHDDGEQARAPAGP